MRFAINIPNFGDFADPQAVADLARRAEAAGWDGLFIWDHVTFEKLQVREIGDPWVLLTAAALATRRIRLGTMITPIARRRVSKLAREVTTLDRLSGGRMVLGAGLGAPIGDEFGSFDEPTDPRLLAARLDEGLEALNLLWSGAPVTFRGAHVRIEDVVFRPVPVQQPRVPVWVGGNWPNKAPMRRAARWDGAVPNLDPGAALEALPPDPATVRALHSFLQRRREEAGNEHKPFDLVVGGMSPAGTGSTRDMFGSLEEVGATWWQECMPWDERLGRAGPMLRRAEQGPARGM
jgi:alkanesulfonate monooxygenase SsuD/methylene tetrahydromethanopterin reductase-like flavin-dependent oxidoreductase (luciferase family)